MGSSNSSSGSGGSKKDKDDKNQTSSPSKDTGTKKDNKSERREREKKRQQEWRDKHKGETTNESRRNPQTGEFENVRTDYSRDKEDRNRSQQGWSQHGSITDDRGTRKYEGATGDTSFGRDLGAYGRGMTAEEAEDNMKASNTHLDADSAWNAGNYREWLDKEMEATTMDVTNSLTSNWNDFKNAPLDYTADMARNPFVGAAAALMAPPVALGLVGLKMADTVADYFQGEVTGVEAVRQGAGDLADSIRDQGLATLAHFVNDPEGTISGQVGSDLQKSLAGHGGLGAIAAMAAPSLVSKGIGALTSETPASTGGALSADNVTGDSPESLREANRDHDLPVQTSVAATPPTSMSVTSRGRSFTPNPSWQASVQDMYGLDALPDANNPSTLGTVGGKIKTNISSSPATTLIDNYPWLFGQSILSKPTNPYAVTS